MTKYSKIIFGILAAALCVLLVPRASAPSDASGTGSAEQADREGKADKKDSSKSLDEAENADKTENTENTYDTEPAELKEYIDYKDAEGTVHTMVVDQSVRENMYDGQKFVADGNDPQRTTYSDPGYTVLQGIDVSEHQGEIDWEEVADEGWAFAFIRVGYRGYGEAGNLHEDKRAIENLRSAKEAGLMVGAYIFSQALDEEEAREEAELAVSVIEESEIELNLPLVYDPEIITNDDGRANDITREQVALNARAFREEVESGSDIRAEIYSNLQWEHELYDAETLNDYEIWYADYGDSPQTPYHFGWWQYSEEGSVAGIEGNVDLDMWIISGKPQ